MNLDKNGIGGVRNAYQQGQNIIRLIKDQFNLQSNEQAAILLSYDLQSGSYVSALNDAGYRAWYQRFTAELADVIRPLAPRSGWRRAWGKPPHWPQ